MSDLHIKNDKTWQKEIKEDLSKQEKFPWSWVKKLNTLKIAGLPQIDLQIQYNPSRKARYLSCRNGQADIKIVMEMQEMQKSQNNLEKGEQS